MRLRDRGGTNAIPLNRRVAAKLYDFFNSAAFCGPVGVHNRSRMLLGLIVNLADHQKTGRYDILPGGTEEVESWS